MEELFDNIPDHYYDNFSDDFVTVLAALRWHGFTILRADEGKEAVDEQNLYAELSHPSIWLHAASTADLAKKLPKLTPGSLQHTGHVNQIIRANLLEQKRLLALLEEFYKTRTPSFYARLIVETHGLGETYLRSQGSSVRIMLEDEKLQKQWLKDSNTELLAFAKFLVETKNARL